MNDSDGLWQLIILAGVLALVMRKRQMNWAKLAIALLAIAAVAVVIDKFFL